MNKLPQTQEELKVDDNKQEENIAMFLALIFALPMFIVSGFVKNRTNSSKIWELYSVERKKLLFSVATIPVWLLFQFLFLQQIFQFHFKFAVIYWIVGVFIGFGTSLLVIRFSLPSIANDLFFNRLDPHKAIYIKSAIFGAGLNYAKKIFERNGNTIPTKDASEKPLIGILANPIDYRSRGVRRKFPERNKLSAFVSGDYVVAPLNKQDPIHQLVIADTGVGKTRLLSRLALAGLNENWKVVIIDFKGANDEKVLYSQLGKFIQNKKIEARIFPDEPFNIFKGSNEDITQKLISFLPPLTGSPADFYTKRMMRALEAVVNNPNLIPPKDPHEVLHRVKQGSQFAEKNIDKLWFASKEKGLLVSDIVETDIAQCFLPLTGHRKLHLGNTWSGNWDLMMFSLDGNQRSDVLIGEAILMDFDNHLRKSERTLEERNYLLIIDEAGVLNNIGGSNALPSLISRSRSAGVGVVLASQSLISLGKIGEEISETTPMRWLGRMSNPQALVNLVGTYDVIESNYSNIAGEWSSSVSGKIQKSYIVDPDRIRQLPKFFWNLSSGGENIWVYEPPL